MSREVREKPKGAKNASRKPRPIPKEFMRRQLANGKERAKTQVNDAEAAAGRPDGIPAAGKGQLPQGGKSLVLGWDSRWGTPRIVAAAGSSTTGTMRPYGLDCSGFVDWVFYNVLNGAYVLGHGDGASMQHAYCADVPWTEAKPGDLAFYPDDSHVGIICGYDEAGNVQIIHCAYSANNVVVTGKSGFTAVGRPYYYSE